MPRTQDTKKGNGTNEGLHGGKLNDDKERKVGGEHRDKNRKAGQAQKLSLPRGFIGNDRKGDKMGEREKTKASGRETFGPCPGKKMGREGGEGIRSRAG